MFYTSGGPNEGLWWQSLPFGSQRFFLVKMKLIKNFINYIGYIYYWNFFRPKSRKPHGRNSARTPQWKLTMLPWDGCKLPLWSPGWVAAAWFSWFKKSSNIFSFMNFLISFIFLPKIFDCQRGAIALYSPSLDTPLVENIETSEVVRVYGNSQSHQRRYRVLGIGQRALLPLA